MEGQVMKAVIDLVRRKVVGDVYGVALFELMCEVEGVRFFKCFGSFTLIYAS